MDGSRLILGMNELIARAIDASVQVEASLTDGLPRRGIAAAQEGVQPPIVRRAANSRATILVADAVMPGLSGVAAAQRARPAGR